MKLHRFTSQVRKRVTVNGFAALGVASAIVTFTSFFDILADVNVWLKSSWGLVLIVVGAVSWGVYKGWPKSVYEFTVRGRDTKVRMVIGDLCQQGGALIVPINDEFDVSLSGSVRSAKSVIAKVIKQYFGDNENQLQTALSMALKDGLYSGLGTGVRFPIGTTAVVEHGNSRFYFVANSVKRTDRRVEARQDDLLPTLGGLWAHIGTHGPKEELAIPLLGTGSGRLPMPREEVFKEIVLSFIASCAVSNYCDSLTIVLSTKDVDSHKMNIDELEEFLSLNCRHAVLRQSAAPSVGTPVESAPETSGTSGTSLQT